jgi:hypothetical protein
VPARDLRDHRHGPADPRDADRRFAKLKVLLRPARRRTVEGLWTTVAACLASFLAHRVAKPFPPLRLSGHYTLMKIALNQCLSTVKSFIFRSGSFTALIKVAMIARSGVKLGRWGGCSYSDVPGAVLNPQMGDAIALWVDGGSVNEHAADNIERLNGIRRSNANGA